MGATYGVGQSKVPYTFKQCHFFGFFFFFVSNFISIDHMF